MSAWSQKEGYDSEHQTEGKMENLPAEHFSDWNVHSSRVGSCQNAILI